MSDADLRSLERDLARDDARLASALLRAGRLDRVRLEALAQLGDPWALAVLGLREAPVVAEFGSRRGSRDRADAETTVALARDVRRVRTVSREAALRACLAACRPIRHRAARSVRAQHADARGVMAFAEGRLADPPRTWEHAYLYEHDRARWTEECSLAPIGMVIDAWSMLLHGFEDSKDWSGARCVLLALGEAPVGSGRRSDTEEAMRADMIRELRAWALCEVAS